MKKSKGITLIALIITIIVLLILAGISVNLLLGENGILEHASTSTETYGVEAEREELRLEILDVQTEIMKLEGRKATLEDLEARIDKNKYEISLEYNPIAATNVVKPNATYANIIKKNSIYVFTVDPKLIITKVEEVAVVNGTANVEITSKVKEYVGKDENGKYRVKFELTFNTMQDVQSIKVEGYDETIDVVVDSNLTKEVSVEIGKSYTVIVTMNDGTFKKIKIKDEAEEVITNANELVAFRDRVNSGLSYEGKTVKLANDIDLSSVCHAADSTKGLAEVSWEPISGFYGIFNGYNHIISNLYIYSEFAGGLFLNNNGSICNLKMTAVNITITNSNAAIICVLNLGNVENIVITSGNVTATSGGVGSITALNFKIVKKCINAANINGTSNVGGIAGWLDANTTVEECINVGSVESTNGTCVGGIVGKIQNVSSNIFNCYNLGQIKSGGQAGGIVGFVNLNTNKVTVNIQNCYNIGKIECSSYKGGIIGAYTNTTGSTFNITNNYWISTCGPAYGIGKANKETGCTKFTTNLDYTLLGDAFISDGKIKNEQGEWVDNRDKDGKIIYINNGYPILKWQMEK